MRRSNIALAISGVMIKRAIDGADVGNFALDSGTWAPGPLGAVANAGAAVRDFGHGNWGSGLMDAINVPLSLVGGNDLTKGIAAGGKWLLGHAPTFGRLGGNAVGALASKGLNAGRSIAGWMSKQPGLNHIPGAFGTDATRSAANWGATNSLKSLGGNAWKSMEWSGKSPFIRPMMRNLVESPIAGSKFLGAGGVGNLQNQRAEAGVRAQGGWDQLKNFAGSYGATPPGEIGPHNAALMAGPGNPEGFPLYSR